MIQLKRDYQIDGIRKSCKLLAACLLRLDEEIQPGFSTYHIERLCHDFIKQHHAIPSCLGY